MPKKKKTNRAYPYKIHSLEPYPESFIGLSPWQVNRFFLIEALLRSEKAIEAFNQSRKKFYSFFEGYGVNLDPLAREHHCLMRSVSDPDFETVLDDKFVRAGFVRNTGIINTTILDMAAVTKLGPSGWWPKGGEAEMLEQLRNPLPRFIYLRLDVSFTASANIETLKPLLMNKHDQYNSTEPQDWLEQTHRECLTTTFDDIDAWIKYFRCKDLDRCEDLSYSKIAIEVYGSASMKSRDRAKKAVSHASRAITAAENNSWPPRKPSR